MREGREIARESKRFASEQRGRSWFHLLTTLGIFVGLIAVTCSAFAWPVRLGASLVLALVHVRLFVIFHDYQHEAILQDSKLAKLVFSIYGLLTMTPPSIWKHTHDGHHLTNSRRFGLASVGSFPVMTIEDYRHASHLERVTYRVMRHPLTLALGYLTVFLWGFCVEPFLRNPRRHLDGAASIALHGGLVLALALLRPDVMLLAVVLPSCIGSALGAYLFYAQHNFPGVKLRTGKDWDHVFAALHSSSYLRMGPIMQWFTGNIGYHHIHHLNAHIPFYRLPEAMSAQKELQSPTTTTLHPVDIFRCLRLQLWDPNAGRLVSFREAHAALAA